MRPIRPLRPSPESGPRSPGTAWRFGARNYRPASRRRGASGYGRGSRLMMPPATFRPPSTTRGQHHRARNGVGAAAEGCRLAGCSAVALSAARARACGARRLRAGGRWSALQPDAEAWSSSRPTGGRTWRCCSCCWWLRRRPGFAALDSPAPASPPRLELRRPGRERGRLPITPGSSGLMPGTYPPAQSAALSLRAGLGRRLRLDRHETLVAVQRLEAVALVKPVGIRGGQHHARQIAHGRVLDDGLDQRLSQAAAAWPSST